MKLPDPSIECPQCGYNDWAWTFRPKPKGTGLWVRIWCSTCDLEVCHSPVYPEEFTKSPPQLLAKYAREGIRIWLLDGPSRQDSEGELQ